MTCSIEGCTGKVRARGWCWKHYCRWRDHGDPSAVPLRPRVGPKLCVIESCGKPHRARGWCAMHYARWEDLGDPLADVPPLLDRDDIAYSTQHRRLRLSRGQASDYLCVGCGAPAEDWSYDHLDPEERVGAEGWVYSLDFGH